MVENYNRKAALPIVEMVASHLRVPVEEIFGTRRSPRVVRARALSMYLIRQRLNYSLTETGSAFGRDHTTVLKSLERFERALGRDAALKTTVVHLQQVLRGLMSEDPVLCIPLPKIALSRLHNLLATGLFGATLEEVAQRVLLLKLHELMDKKEGTT